jgi:phosphohistidine phosphatase SixA
MPETMRKEHAKLRRRPFLTPLWLTSIAGAAALIIASWFFLTASTTMVFVLRHAETSTAPGDDPELSMAGKLRAERLSAVFAGVTGGTALDGVVVNEWRRTQQTAQPLANALGIPVVVVSSTDPREAAHRALDDFDGSPVLIVADADAIPRIVEELSGEDVPVALATDFDTLYVVSHPRLGRNSLVMLRLP